MPNPLPEGKAHLPRFHGEVLRKFLGLRHLDRDTGFGVQLRVAIYEQGLRPPPEPRLELSVRVSDDRVLIGLSLNPNGAATHGLFILVPDPTQQTGPLTRKHGLRSVSVTDRGCAQGSVIIRLTAVPQARAESRNIQAWQLPQKRVPQLSDRNCSSATPLPLKSLKMSRNRSHHSRTNEHLSWLATRSDISFIRDSVEFTRHDVSPSWMWQSTGESTLGHRAVVDGSVRLGRARDGPCPLPNHQPPRRLQPPACPASSSWQGFFLFEGGGGGVGVPEVDFEGAGSGRWPREGARCCIRCGSPQLVRPASMRRGCRRGTGVRTSTSRTRVPGTRSGVVSAPVCGCVAVQGEM